jgi:hypothetical protein
LAPRVWYATTAQRSGTLEPPGCGRWSGSLDDQFRVRPIGSGTQRERQQGQTAMLFLLLALQSLALQIGAYRVAPPELPQEFELVQNATFFQFVPNADGFMIGTGRIHTANTMSEHAFFTHWVSVVPTSGTVCLLRMNFRVQYYLDGESARSVAIPPFPEFILQKKWPWRRPYRPPLTHLRSQGLLWCRSGRRWAALC